MSLKTHQSIWLTAMLAFCSSGCAHQTEESTPANQTTGATTLVYKYSGAVQCDKQSGMPLAQMKQQLSKAGIEVLCMQSERDGLHRIQMCGANSGQVNIYKIFTKDLAKAESDGFSNVNKLTRLSLEKRCK